MKYFFILNPQSGRKVHNNDILREIRDAAVRQGHEYDAYFTKAPGDAKDYVRRLCEAHAKAGDGDEPEPIRIIGCGGDGTLNELVNGAFGFDQVEIGIIPQGTGNDYIRNYGDPKRFLSVENQMLGHSRWSDLIEYCGENKGVSTRALCANMFNIGFDCNVVIMTETLKNWPLLNGSTAYLASVFASLVQKKETHLTVEYEDGEVYDDRLLLVSIANGCFCGGGIKGVPKSVLDDGLMDISLVRSGVSRNFFVRFFPKYQKGKHLDDPRAAGVFSYRQCETLRVKAKEGLLNLCADGEIEQYESVDFRVVPKAVRFIVPQGL